MLHGTGLHFHFWLRGPEQQVTESCLSLPGPELSHMGCTKLWSRVSMFCLPHRGQLMSCLTKLKDWENWPDLTRSLTKPWAGHAQSSLHELTASQNPIEDSGSVFNSWSFTCLATELQNMSGLPARTGTALSMLQMTFLMKHDSVHVAGRTQSQPSSTKHDKTTNLPHSFQTIHTALIRETDSFAVWLAVGAEAGVGI